MNQNNAEITPHEFETLTHLVFQARDKSEGQHFIELGNLLTKVSSRNETALRTETVKKMETPLIPEQVNRAKDEMLSDIASAINLIMQDNWTLLKVRLNNMENVRAQLEKADLQFGGLIKQ